ncbi:calnexin isoform X2 [Nasonia vitripennis]|uniref:Calnexin n=1 Tax=Nasonia vitripennis TaxID=7425 RepID=A0A7M7R1S1_NASVI|nr:calnexin isoform X2 [Nasonia vitripennis]XP_032456966.1 calnexin isoform X2 [Nasonia vitripennis]XP_032456967.1 calnexin isoform X2 [Nasonia vitripennis]XP_032456968.1 calnexin isoform X2 [Nasonia vitripennis]XP_032456969.1 calnexin isoform X2 [Nasonia vitripennis]XP_032456970.1 calnexin isoform X2 [Nasonia vitripennis]XP_032456971.1 calnexin isoform X2 [Nasonia vitripennis]
MALTRRQVLCLLLLAVCSRFVPSRAAEPEVEDVVVEDEPADNEPKIEDYKSPELPGNVYLADHFDDKQGFDKIWIQSQAKKENIDEDIAKYDGIWAVEEPKRSVENGNLGLVLKSKARHAALSALLNKPFIFDDKPLIVQYEVIFQEGQECGGAYLKLISVDPQHKDLRNFHDKTPYSIMFGPDKCGNDHMLHFIFRHRNPLNGSIEEKHAKKPKERLEDFFKDKQPHLYTLVVRPDNTFEVKVDGNVVNEGSLLDDFNPPVNPPLEIEDPNDKRPEDWDEREKIPDPTAVKPEDWDEDAPAQIVDENDQVPEGWLEDEPSTIPNPDSVKPADWDEEMDGEWEPPEIQNPKCLDAPGCGPYKKRLISNPKYKGKWLPPLINNPNYQGKWKPRLIHNPEYFNDENPFRMTPIYAVGFELWSMSPDILFDNIIVTDDEIVAQKWAEQTFEVRKQRIAIESSGLYQQVVNFTVEHPWIWTVYLILLGIPIMLIIYCCCFTSKDSQDKEDDTENENEELLQKDKEESEAATVEEVNGDKVEESPESEEQAEEIIKSKESISTAEGPRRRKANKE